MDGKQPQTMLKLDYLDRLLKMHSAMDSRQDERINRVCDSIEKDLELSKVTITIDGEKVAQAVKDVCSKISRDGVSWRAP